LEAAGLVVLPAPLLQVQVVLEMLVLFLLNGKR
jgi:hypothetical protein